MAVAPATLGTMFPECGSRLDFREDRSMDPFTAVKQARNYIRLAEDATGTDRDRYLRAAKRWLERADVDAWFKHKPSSAVIIASDEKQTRL